MGYVGEYVVLTCNKRYTKHTLSIGIDSQRQVQTANEPNTEWSYQEVGCLGYLCIHWVSVWYLQKMVYY